MGIEKKDNRVRGKNSDRKGDLEHRVLPGHLCPLASAVPLAIREWNSAFAFLEAAQVWSSEMHMGWPGVAAAKETW